MKIHYTEAEAAAIRLELTVVDLQLMRSITQAAIANESAPYGAKGLSAQLDRALATLSEAMRRTADGIEAQ